MYNYDLGAEKREVQKKLFPLVQKQRVITLGGPNLLSYINMYPKHVKELQVWENDPKTMVVQASQFSTIKKAAGRKFDYRFGDIIKADIDKSSFYDLDFCCTIVKASKHIERFKDCQFTTTLCLRAHVLEKTIRDFLISVKEKKKLDIPHRQFNLLRTNKSQYLYTTYTDSTPMVTIFKLEEN